MRLPFVLRTNGNRIDRSFLFADTFHLCLLAPSSARAHLESPTRCAYHYYWNCLVQNDQPEGEGQDRPFYTTFEYRAL